MKRILTLAAALICGIALSGSSAPVAAAPLDLTALDAAARFLQEIQVPADTFVRPCRRR